MFPTILPIIWASDNNEKQPNELWNPLWERIKKIDYPDEKTKRRIPFPSYFAHPKPLEEYWVGRKKELTQLNQWYQVAKVVGIVAFGGFGKSALARKWLNELIDSERPPDGIFWWCFYRETSLDAFLEAALNYFSGGLFQPEDASNAYARVRKLREYLTKGRFVLVLDGLEDLQKADDRGEHFGEMLEWSFTDLLRGIAEDSHHSFVLITTRYPLQDLKPYEGQSFYNLPLLHLSPEDALALMRKQGVNGEDSALDNLAYEYGYHALSLKLISGYLNDYYGGDIAYAPRISFKYLETEEKVNRILAAYGEKLDAAEKVFMEIFCTFRYQVDKNALSAVFRQPISEFDNHSLVELSDIEFHRMIKHLINLGLISQDEDRSEITYSSHPLIRKYYYAHMEEKVKLGLHQRLAQHYLGMAYPQPQTLDDLAPAIEVYHHSIRAKDYEEALEIYYQRINTKDTRGTYLLANKLGVFELDLSLISQLFPDGDMKQEPLISSIEKQAEIIGGIGYCFMMLGQLMEALPFFQRNIKMRTDQKKWANASGGNQNLCWTHLRLGNLAQAEEAARQAVDLACKANNKQYERNSLGYWAYTAFLEGKKEAEELFEQTSKIEREINQSRKYLCSLRGIQYAEFLAQYQKLDLAKEVTLENLETCLQNNWTNDVSSCYRLLVEVSLARNDYPQADDYIIKGLQIARNNNLQEEIAKLNLGSARLHIARQNLDNASVTLKETLSICTRCGYKLIEINARNVLARIYLIENQLELARQEAQTALEMSITCGYYWGQVDAQGILIK